MKNLQTFLNENADSISSFEIKYPFITVRFKNGGRFEIESLSSEEIVGELYDSEGKYVGLLE